jgi:beta-glucosidase
VAGRHIYSEGIHVGYRGYDRRGTAPLFPFGHGLSYTEFRYDGLHLSADAVAPDAAIAVDVTLTNTGARPGQEVVQIYIRPIAPDLVRPPRELKAFGKIALEPGETGCLRFTLTARDFSHFDPDAGRFVLRAKGFVVEAAASSRDIRLAAALDGYHTPPPQRALKTTTAANLFLADPRAATLLQDLLARELGLSTTESAALIARSRTSFLSIYDTLSWYIGENLTEAAMQAAFDRGLQA